MICYSLEQSKIVHKPEFIVSAEVFATKGNSTPETPIRKYARASHILDFSIDLAIFDLQRMAGYDFLAAQ
jgi:hypothetical protein